MFAERACEARSRSEKEAMSQDIIDDERPRD